MKFKLNSILSLLLILALTGCEQEFDNTIENFNPGYQAVSVTPSGQVRFNAIDSLIIISVKINSPANIKSVYCEIYSSDEKKLNQVPLELLDNGLPVNGDSQISDGTFSSKFPMSTFYPNGNYTIRYYVLDKSGETGQIALSTFLYDNGQDNSAPVISDVIVEPDTAVVTGTQVILTSVSVSDDNSLSDIEKVYFVVYRPDGSTSGFQNSMFDDGSIALHGDNAAEDGIYSLLIQINSSNQKGTYRFEFAARDRGGKTSNIINHNVLIQ